MQHICVHAPPTNTTLPRCGYPNGTATSNPKASAAGPLPQPTAHSDNHNPRHDDHDPPTTSGTSKTTTAPLKLQPRNKNTTTKMTRTIPDTTHHPLPPPPTQTQPKAGSLDLVTERGLDPLRGLGALPPQRQQPQRPHHHPLPVVLRAALAAAPGPGPRVEQLDAFGRGRRRGAATSSGLEPP